MWGKKVSGFPTHPIPIKTIFVWKSLDKRYKYTDMWDTNKHKTLSEGGRDLSDGPIPTHPNKQKMESMYVSTTHMWAMCHPGFLASHDALHMRLGLHRILVDMGVKIQEDGNNIEMRRHEINSITLVISSCVAVGFFVVLLTNMPFKEILSVSSVTLQYCHFQTCRGCMPVQ